MIKIIKKDFWFLLLTVFLLPTYLVHAKTLKDIIKTAKDLVADTIPLVIGLALVYFIYGIAQYISNSGDAAKKEEGKTRMTWGIIALFVIISVWGLVSLIQYTIWSGGPTSSELTTPPVPILN